MTRILRLPEVMQITGLSKATIYRKLKAKQFPVQVRPSDSAVGWRDNDIQAWVESLEHSSTITPAA